MGTRTMDKLINAGKDFLEDRQDKNQSSGGFFDRDDDDDFRDAKDEADKRAGSSGSGAMFSQIIGAIGQKKSTLQSEDLDEEDAVRKHKKQYDDDDDSDEDSLGTAAALQALKMFNNGETGQKQGKVASGASKESVVQKAGEMAMKMYLKSQGQQQG